MTPKKKKRIPKWAKDSEAVIYKSKETGEIQFEEPPREDLQFFVKQRVRVSKATADEILAHVDEVKFWQSLLECKNPSIRLGAGIFLYEQKWGKARQKIEHDAPHLRTLAERLQQARNQPALPEAKVTANDFLQKGVTIDAEVVASAQTENFELSVPAE